ncbi:MAG TPA: ATP-dependent DNA ligase [Candidatus Methanomethylophilaceae archaeon]|nr:ATP-dependent DNA ligase [Candidatus Methanomethylophilaceae archaeon]
MLFAELAKTFDRIESEPSRLSMTAILSDFLKTVEADEISDVIFLSQGKLRPDFYPQVFGMSDKLVIKAITSTVGMPESEVTEIVIKEGDPGTAAEKLIKKKKQMTLFSHPLTLERVVKSLENIENSEGRDSQNRKTKILSNMLHDSEPVEARYLCRIVTGRMRVGAGTMTILDALADAFATKEDRPEIERAFNITCDMGLVATTVAEGGMDAIRKIEVGVGNPLKVMLAERLRSIPEVVERLGGRCAMEYKYDGIRIQAHIKKDSVKLYSRRLEDLTPNFPDVAATLRERCKVEEAIVEGECVAVDEETGYMLPFQEITHRRKKHGIGEAITDYPVRMFLFDMLYSDGEDLTHEPYLDRRSAIEKNFDISGDLQMTTMRIVSSPEEGQQFFDEALAARCEGIMAKSISQESIYRAGSRGFLWIKYKRDYQQALVDTFDLSVVGAFHGRGKRAGKYGALLMAAYDEDSGRFGTACKLGTGFDDEFLDKLPDMLEPYRSLDKPSSVDAQMIPDVWFEPYIVLEVTGAEMSISPIHTASMGHIKDDSGLGIRFPRFTGRVRNDKDATESTTYSEMTDLYLLQEQDPEDPS